MTAPTAQPSVSLTAAVKTPRRRRVAVSEIAPQADLQVAPPAPVPTPAPVRPIEHARLPLPAPVPVRAVDPDLLTGLQKIADDANSVSTFEQFLNPADRAALDASRPAQGPPRTPEDDQNIRVIRSYREEFSNKEIPLPEDAELDQMTSEQLQDVVKRCRGGIARGISKNMISSTYFSLTGMAESVAPAYGWHLEGLTQSLKQSKDVDDCLRCAYAEARSQITTSLPWYVILPAVTAQTAIAVHYGHEAELAARRLLDRPVKKSPQVNNGPSNTESRPAPTPAPSSTNRPADGRRNDMASGESRPNANPGQQRVGENDLSALLMPVS